MYMIHARILWYICGNGNLVHFVYVLMKNENYADLYRFVFHEVYIVQQAFCS